MNKTRRKELTRAAAMIDEAATILLECGLDEESYADEMPENLQASEKYDRAMEAAQTLEELSSECYDLTASTKQVIE
ncbi:hypothetical protein N9913_02450 [Porticoccaceae bacterium]|nr:hypothetical protein [Porticoccaceae bacterium]